VVESDKRKGAIRRHGDKGRTKIEETGKASLRSFSIIENRAWKLSAMSIRG
jgi:hypothetical protein